MPNRVPAERIQYSGDSGLGSNGTLHFISKEEAIERLLEIHPSLSGVCKVVGLNSLVRQFGLRFQCNGIKQLAKDFLKACTTFHGTLPFLQFPLQHTLSTPMAHLNGYRLMLLIWHLARRGHCKWSLFMTNNRGQYLSRTLFGTYHVRGKECTVFLTSGEEKLSYSIFSLVLYSAHIMLEVKSVQFTSHQGKKVKLQHYFSFSFSISFYSARIMLGVRVHSFPFIRVGKLSYSILILRFQAKMLEYSHVGLAFMWYVFYFKFPPLKTFTRKTLQLSSEGIIVKRGNSCEKIVPSRCLSSLDSKILVIVWQPSWMGFNQMF